METIFIIIIVVPLVVTFPSHLAAERALGNRNVIRVLGIGGFGVACLGLMIPSLLLIRFAADRTLSLAFGIVFPGCVVVGVGMWGVAMYMAVVGKSAEEARGFPVVPVEREREKEEG